MKSRVSCAGVLKEVGNRYQKYLKKAYTFLYI